MSFLEYHRIAKCPKDLFLEDFEVDEKGRSAVRKQGHELNIPSSPICFPCHQQVLNPVPRNAAFFCQLPKSVVLS